MKLTIKKGKGVLGKDGKPFNPGTAYQVRGKWNCAMPYSVSAILAALTNPEVSEISVIDAGNVEYTMTIERSKGGK